MINAVAPTSPATPTPAQPTGLGTTPPAPPKPLTPTLTQPPAPTTPPAPSAHTPLVLGSDPTAASASSNTPTAQAPVASILSNSNPAAPYTQPSVARHLPDPTDPPRTETTTDTFSQSSAPSAADTVPPTSGKPPLLVSSPASTPGPTAFPPTPPTPGSGAGSKSDGGASQKDDLKKGLSFSPRVAVSAIVLALMLVGGAAGFYLTQQNQDLRQQASTAESCPSGGFTSEIPGSTRCSGDQRQVSSNVVCTEWQAANCTGVCDKYVWEAHGEQRWCDADDTYHTCQGGNSTSTGECCGSSCQAPEPPDNGGGTNPSLPACATGAFNCSNYNSDPAGCSSHHEGQGCYFDKSSNTCGCDGGGSAVGGTNASVTTSCLPGSATAKNNSTSEKAVVVVNTCSDNYGSVAEYDAGTSNGSSCTTGTCSQQRVELAPGEEKTFGNSAPQCGRYQVDVHIASGIGSGCGASACTGSQNCATPPPPVVQKPPIGNHDTNSCDAVYGWSCDPDKFDQNVNIDFWIGSDTSPESRIGSAQASLGANDETERATIAELCGGNGNRRFIYELPDEVKSQVGKYIYAYAINIDASGNPTHVDGGPTEGQNTQLFGSPKIIESCTSPTATMKGRVYCADNSEPVSNAWLKLTRQNSVEINMEFGVDTAGNWTVGSQLGFNPHTIEYMSPDPSTIGTGPKLNAEVAARYGCTISGNSYSNCTLKEGENTGFDFVFENCAPPPPKPTANFSAVCTDTDPSNGLNYTFTVSNIQGTAPFMWSRIFLGFNKTATGGNHVQAISDFLGTPTWCVPVQKDANGATVPCNPALSSWTGWYGYQLHEFGHTQFTIGSDGLGIGNLTLDWNNTASGKASANIGSLPTAKTVAELAMKTTELLDSSTLSDADKAKIRKYSVGANLASGGRLVDNKWTGGSQNDYIGGTAIELTTTACTKPIGPMCMLITAHKVTGSTPVETPVNVSTLRIGDQIQFKCGANAAAPSGTTYQFRVLKADKKLLNNLQARGAYSETFSISAAGTFYAQCRICVPTGTAGAQGEPVCQPWYDPAGLQPPEDRPALEPVDGSCVGTLCDSSVGPITRPGPTNGPVTSGGSTTGGTTSGGASSVTGFETNPVVGGTSGTTGAATQ